jgi:hypothetical protein
MDTRAKARAVASDMADTSVPTWTPGADPTFDGGGNSLNLSKAGNRGTASPSSSSTSSTSSTTSTTRPLSAQQMLEKYQGS